MTSLVDLVPALSDGTIRLRAPSPGDVDAVVEQVRDEASIRWTTASAGYTRLDAVDFITRTGDDWRDPSGARRWVIEATDPDGAPRFGGTIGLAPGQGWDHASISYASHPDARGRGATSRAVRLVAAHAFEHGPWGRPLARIHWGAVAGDWASRRVAWATGFTFHGTLTGGHANTVDPDGPGMDAWQGSLGRDDPMRPRSPWFEPPVIAGDGIRLRPWREEDVDGIETRDGDPGHWMPPHAVLGEEMFPGWLFTRRLRMSEGAAIEWCVADSESDAVLGAVVVFSRSGPITGDVAELGYQLNPAARGRGIAKEAARLAVRHATTDENEGGLGLRRLVAETAADNVASNRILESVGFTLFGREHAVDPLPDGRYGDGLHWELLRPPGNAPLAEDGP
jgi:RimJ/RimL family protein N-acetyltransferase